MQREAQDEEEARLAALETYDILDTPQEEGLDRITRLTRRIFGVPMSTITLIDGHRQWFKARSGVEACETARDPALCNVAMRERRILVVPDTRTDPRFADNPFVIGPRRSGSMPACPCGRPRASASAPSAPWTRGRAASGRTRSRPWWISRMW